MPSLSSFSGKLDRVKAKHLLNRASFGPTRQEIDELVGSSPVQAFNALADHQPEMPVPIDLDTGKPWKTTSASENQRGDRRHFTATLLDHMCRSAPSLSERMAFFHHTFFTSNKEKVGRGLFLLHQYDFFRYYALGNMKTLATKMCYDNAMLEYLDGTQNVADSPNENFGREFLELYSIGKNGPAGEQVDQYTEQDIREAARVFSGFVTEKTLSEIDPDTGIPTGRLRKDHNNEYGFHDFGSKSFSEKFDNRVITPKGTSYQDVLDEVGEFVDMVFGSFATAQRICRRLYRFFIYHDIDLEIEKNIIDPLATELMSNNYELRPTLQTLLTSQHFYDQTSEGAVAGTLVKSPLEMTIGTIRYFEMELPDRTSARESYDLYGILKKRMRDQDMVLYEPPVVAGYPAYFQAPNYQRTWISSSTILYRYDFIRAIFSKGFQKGTSMQMKIDSLKYVENASHLSDPTDATKLVQELADDLYSQPISQPQLNRFVNEVLLDNLSVINWEMEWKAYREKPNGANAQGLRSQLDKLLVAMLQTPEYQLY